MGIPQILHSGPVLSPYLPVSDIACHKLLEGLLDAVHQYMHPHVFQAEKACYPFTFPRGRNLFHAGVIAAGQRPGRARAGELCTGAMQSGTGNYLANLILYPGEEIEATLWHLDK